MSYIQQKSNYAHGIRCFLDKNGFDTSGKGQKSNAIMVKFLKEKDLPYSKWNKNYKGLNTADLVNSETIQDHWVDFRKWVLVEVESLKQSIKRDEA